MCDHGLSYKTCVHRTLKNIHSNQCFTVIFGISIFLNDKIANKLSATQNDRYAVTIIYNIFFFGKYLKGLFIRKWISGHPRCRCKVCFFIITALDRCIIKKEGLWLLIIHPLHNVCFFTEVVKNKTLLIIFFWQNVTPCNNVWCNILINK